ncbi:hypothetical protein ACFLYH_03345 [Candidatus Dependentiae bacterium]
MKNTYALILLGITSILALGAMEGKREKSYSKTNEQKIVLGKRPKNVQDAVNKAFERLEAIGKWPNNGKEEYRLFGIKDEVLLKEVASKSGKKDIYIIDAGCANGAWGIKAMDTLCGYEKFKKSGKKFYIFSITGGKECKKMTKTNGNVKLFQINSFKIENIDTEFKKISKEFGDLSLNGNVDLIVSSSTFRHFVDPFGTLKRMYVLLSSSNGILISDNFNFNFADSEWCSIFPVTIWGKEEYGEIIASTGAACLFYYNLYKNNNDFILMRTDGRELDIPLNYSDVLFEIFKVDKCAVFNKRLFFGKKNRFSKEFGLKKIVFYCDDKNPKKCLAKKILLKFFPDLDEFKITK